MDCIVWYVSLLVDELAYELASKLVSLLCLGYEFWRENREWVMYITL